MTGVHAPRPTDLIALVSFDGELVANEAVTRDRLGRPTQSPHALAATIQHWLRRGRRMWIDVRGRQIQGLATARELAKHKAWEIDTLVDATRDGYEVTTALLAQAGEAAAEAGVGHVLLRMHADAPAIAAARRAGFVVALQERLWAGSPVAPEGEGAADTATACAVRETEEADAHALFQLHNRALPIGARQAIAMTFEEWEAVDDRRWAGRGSLSYVAVDDGRVRGALRLEGEQFTLLVEPGAEETARALLHVATPHLLHCDRVLALLPDCAATPAGLLRARGFEPGDEYVLLALRTASLVRDAVPVRAARRVVPTRG